MGAVKEKVRKTLDREESYGLWKGPKEAGTQANHVETLTRWGGRENRTLVAPGFLQKTKKERGS